MASEEDVWPHWPTDGKAQRMVDVQVGCSADELFILLYGPKSQYVSKAQEEIGNKDYKETWWAKEAELVAGGQGSAPKAALKPAEHEGLSRRTTCSGSGMGIKYVNTEIQRCLEAQEGGPFEVDVIVHTTATYGDRFRPILKHRIVSAGQEKCTYTVDYTLVYIVNTNSFLKKAIERGAYNGVFKNFEILVDVLSKFKTVKKTGEASQEAAASSEVSSGKDAKPVLAAGGAYRLPWWSLGVSPEGVRLLERPASWIKARTGLGRPGISAARGSNVATALACTVMVAVLASLLFLLQASQASCAASSGMAGRACATALGALDVPASLRQVITAAALLAAANVITAAVVAAVAHRLPQPVVKAAESAEAIDHPASGIRYDGFEQSLQSAAANIAQGEGDLEKTAAPSSSRAAEVALRTGGKLRDTFKLVGFKGWTDGIKRGRQGSGSLGDEPVTSGVSPPAAAPNGSHRKQVSMPADLPGTFSEEEDASLAGSHPSSKGNSTFRDYMNAGGLLDKTETMFASWSGSNKPPRPEREVKEELAAAQAMELADLREDESTDPVEEEVFENERYQPLRGWGHQWPGHFLPTDRVGHWSSSASLLNPTLDSASFDAVAPQLREGWEWAEDSWQIDLRGIIDNSVDEEGWTHATDFSWIQWPPPPGTGRFRRVRDYVRRRRYYRTRIFTGPSEKAASGSDGPVKKSQLTVALTKETEAKGAKPSTQLPSREQATTEKAQEAVGIETAPRARSAPTSDPAARADNSQDPSKRVEQLSDGHLLAISTPAAASQTPPVLSPTSGPRASSAAMEGFTRGFGKMSGMLAAASSSFKQGAPGKDKDRAQGTKEPASRKPEAGPPVLARATAPLPETAAAEKWGVAAGSSAKDFGMDLASYFGIRSDEKEAAGLQRRNSTSDADSKQARADSPLPPAVGRVRVSMSCEGDTVRVTFKAEGEAAPRPPHAAAALLREASLVRRELKAAVAETEAALSPPASRFGGDSDISRRGSGASDAAKDAAPITSRGAGGRGGQSGKGSGWASEVFRQATGAMEDLQREWQAKMAFKGSPNFEGKPQSG